MESLKVITEGRVAVMIYFYSPSCSACQSLRPKVTEMSLAHFPKMELFEINASDHPALTAEASVFTAPTILVFFEGKEYLRESKYISIDQLKDKISRYYDMLFS